MKLARHTVSRFYFSFSNSFIIHAAPTQPEHHSYSGLCKVRTGWRRMADGGWRMADGGWRMADSKMRMAR